MVTTVHDLLDVQAYDGERDFDSVARIWRETRWIDPGHDHEKLLRTFLSWGAAEVGLVDGSAECLVHRTPGDLTYDTTPLPLCAITAVTTSHIGRKRGLASALTARALQHGADDGAAVAALGMFEQGFYNRFGFGTGGIDHLVTFDPSTLRVDHVPFRSPVRLSVDDAPEMFDTLRSRHRHHGAVTLDAPGVVGIELQWMEHPFALGYRDDTGRLTHFFAGDLIDENGPFKLNFVVYENLDQLMELLRLLHEFGDQIHVVSMMQPAELSLQTLLDQPYRHRNRTRKADWPSGINSFAWWQLRIMDVGRCVAARHWAGAPVSFSLRVTDPVSEQLERAQATDGWTGVGGDYTIRLGDVSTATSDLDARLPLVTCDVGALTRLWFGVESASALRALGELDAPPDLCRSLDEALRFPRVVAGMPF